MLSGCSPRDLWDLPAADTNFLTDVSLLEDAAQYSNSTCGADSVESAVLNDDRLNTATVAYYTGRTPGSTACFVCDRSNEYAPNITAVRVCQRNGTWSGSPIICGMFLH